MTMAVRRGVAGMAPEVPACLSRNYAVKTQVVAPWIFG
jgi:hypothetical protein